MSFANKLEQILKKNNTEKEKLDLTFNFLKENCMDSKICKLTELDIAEAILCIDDLMEFWKANKQKEVSKIRHKLVIHQTKLLKNDSWWGVFKRCLDI